MPLTIGGERSDVLEAMQRELRGMLDEFLHSVRERENAATLNQIADEIWIAFYDLDSFVKETATAHELARTNSRLQRMQERRQAIKRHILSREQAIHELQSLTELSSEVPQNTDPATNYAYQPPAEPALNEERIVINPRD